MCKMYNSVSVRPPLISFSVFVTVFLKEMQKIHKRQECLDTYSKQLWSFKKAVIYITITL